MADEDPQISFRVKTSGDGLHSITMAETATVLELKTKLAGGDYENIPVERQRLIYSGRVMKNDDTLASYKIKPNNTIHLVKSAASNHTAGAAAAAASGTGAASATAASAGGATPAIPTNMAAGTPADNILAGLTGARFAGHVPLPNMDMFGPDGGMALPSEDHMAEMMANPAVAASIRETLNNPQFVDFLIESNPMLRNTPNARELIQSPMFRQMMTDPEYMRMMTRMRRSMGGADGPGGASAFPAPGATDSTPDGAAASPAAGATPGAGAAGGAAANPFAGLNPAMFGMPGAAGGEGAGANPFAMFGIPGAGAAGAGAAGATGAAGDAGAQGAAGAGAAANPFGSLFGGGGMPQITPEMMQQMQQLFGGAGGAGGFGGLGGAGGFNPFGAAAAPAAPADTRPPEEMYADQLRQLNDMGFYDFDQNVAALRRTGGSVQGAIQHLLGD